MGRLEPASDEEARGERERHQQQHDRGDRQPLGGELSLAERYCAPVPASDQEPRALPRRTRRVDDRVVGRRQVRVRALLAHPRAEAPLEVVVRHRAIGGVHATPPFSSGTRSAAAMAARSACSA